MHGTLPWNSLRVTDDCRGEVSPDDRSGRCYLLDADLKTAVETAIVINRPLLLSGQPGCGKSSLAPFIARNQEWRYYEFNVQRRSKSTDLLWEFDALARLRDAQAQVPADKMKAEKYLNPGVMWWAINRHDALECLQKRQASGGTSLSEPNQEINRGRDEKRSVILIDEIDKADPDLPADLLDLLSLYRFTVEENGHQVRRDTDDISKNPSDIKSFPGPLIVFTTNEERDMPPAFRRRCVYYHIQQPKVGEAYRRRLLDIAMLHYSEQVWQSLLPIAEALTERCAKLRSESHADTHGPSIAEFLDALRACVELRIDVKSPIWEQVEACTLRKRIVGSE